MNTTFLAVEAVLCLAPCGFVAAGGLTILLLAGVSMLSYNPIEGLWHILIALGILFALVQYGVLALRTAQARTYRFGFAFWVAVPFALVGVRLAFGGFFELWQAVALMSPVLLATSHFIALQLWRRSRPQSKNVA